MTFILLVLSGQQGRSISPHPRLCTFKQCMRPALWETTSKHGFSSDLPRVRQQPRPKQRSQESAGELHMDSLCIHIYTQPIMFKNYMWNRVPLHSLVSASPINMPAFSLNSSWSHWGINDCNHYGKAEQKVTFSYFFWFFQKYCNWDESKDSFVPPQKEVTMKYKVVVTTMVTAGR